MIIDSHFHPLSMAKKGIVDLPEDITGIAIGTEPGEAEMMIASLPETRSIFISAGSGPWVLNGDRFISADDEIAKLKAEAERCSVDAIGECGIDNHWKYGTPEAQMELFMKEAELAAELDLPLIIHSRDADKEMTEALSSQSFRASAVMHCFSSDEHLAAKALDKGLYISFAGNVTYKANEGIRRAAKAVPRDRILVETDAPYLAPVPMRGKPSDPSMTDITLSYLADLRGEDMEEMKMQVKENLLALLQRNKSVRKLCVS